MGRKAPLQKAVIPLSPITGQDRLAGQTAKGGWAEDTETDVIREIFQAKVRFADIQQELCIRPGANIDSVFAREGLVNDRNSTKAESIIEHFWNPL